MELKKNLFKVLTTEKLLCKVGIWMGDGLRSLENCILVMVHKWGSWHRYYPRPLGSRSFLFKVCYLVSQIFFLSVSVCSMFQLSKVSKYNWGHTNEAFDLRSHQLWVSTSSQRKSSLCSGIYFLNISLVAANQSSAPLLQQRSRNPELPLETQSYSFCIDVLGTRRAPWWTQTRLGKVGFWLWKDPVRAHLYSKSDFDNAIIQAITHNRRHRVGLH